MRINLYSFDRQYNARKMSWGNWTSYVPREQHDELLDKLRAEYNQKSKNINSGYEIGQIRLFKTWPSYMPGWRQLTNYKRVLTTWSWDVQVRCDSTSSSGNSWRWEDGVVDRKLYSTYDYGGTTNYIYPWDSTTGRYDSMRGEHDNTGYGGSGDLNVAAGYKLCVMEYVGGNYWYDKVNNIEYGEPSEEWKEIQRSLKKENNYNEN